jgi:chromate transporter
MQLLLARHFGIGHTEFVHVFSLGQLAPGPNMMMVIVFGYRIAGLAGAATVALAFLLPAGLLCLAAGRLWRRLGESPWRRTVQSALEPIAIGLMCSGVCAVGRAAIAGPLAAALALAGLVLVLRTRVNPVFIVLGAGVLGAAVMYAGGWQ